MRVREIAKFIHVSLSSDRGRASLKHNQYLLRIMAKDTTSIQCYKDWTLTYHNFFQIVFFNCACQSYSDVSSNNHSSYHVHAPLLVLHSISLVLDDLMFYYEVIYVIFIYEFNGYAIYEMEAM
jgi:hypothetical protein